ncbi:MAG: toprim domain-containing protein [Magnetococcales bacterium]|nr:toprim domain-containing protein [Magnetococcales bacterium]
MHGMYGIPTDPESGNQGPKRPLPKQEYFWRNKDRKHKDIQKAADYLIKVRKLPAEQVNKWKGKAFGYTDWVPPNDSVEAAKCGPAVVFPVQDEFGALIGRNQRFLMADKDESKMTNRGRVSGGMYLPTPSVKRAPVIWLVESPIDALTLAAAGCPAVAFLSASFVKSFPLSWLKPTQRLMILADSDKSGRKAAATLYHRAITDGITAQIVDWFDNFKDPNDAMQNMKPPKKEEGDKEDGEKEEKKKDKRTEEEKREEKKLACLEVIGKQARKVNTDLFPVGDAPYIDDFIEFGWMSACVCRLDTTSMRYEREDGGEGSKSVAGFRVYRLDPIVVHDLSTAIGGQAGGSFSRKTLVTYRRANSDRLQREIIEDDEDGNPATWRKLGGRLHNFDLLNKLLQPLGRDRRSKRETVGVFGLVRVGDALQAVDARSGFLTEEECIYSRLQIPSAPPETARPILEKVDGLLKDHLGIIQLGWNLGALMKVFFGFWPHLVIDGHSGSGKTIVANQVMRRLIGYECKEPSELNTEFRQMKILGNHVYPVVFDEISRAKEASIQTFINLLNTSYGGDQTRRHGATRKYLLAAPACLVGQDNPTESDAAINTKTIQFQMDGKKVQGGLFDPDAPFPVLEWCEWLKKRGWTRAKAAERLQAHREVLEQRLMRRKGDTNLDRLVSNYAALQVAIEELFVFSGYRNDGVWKTVVHLMNEHVKWTRATRHESVAVIRQFAREISLLHKHDAHPPYRVDGDRLVIPPQLTMDFLHKCGHSFPIRTNRALVKHLDTDGYCVERNVAKSINGRQFKCVVLDLKKLEADGVDWPRNTDEGHE